MTIDVNEAVAFGVLSVAGTNKVDISPSGVSDEWHALFHSFAHCFDVFAKIANSIVVVNGVLIFNFVKRIESVLDAHN